MNDVSTGSPPATLDRQPPPTTEPSVAPLLDAAAATRCPVRVQLDAFPPTDGAPAPLPAAARLRREAAAAFRVEISAALGDLHPEAVDLRGATDPEGATAAAMAEGAPLIIGGRLADDLVGRRTGTPLLMVRAERGDDEHWAYWPVLVERHKTVGAAEATVLLGDPEAAVVDLAALTPGAAEVGAELRVRGDDALKLAHLHHRLMASGHGSETAIGGVIGKERVVVWQVLDQPVETRRGDREPRARPAPLATYEHEEAVRLAAVTGPGQGEPRLTPILIGECAACPWAARCRPLIEAADSVSLVPGLHERQTLALHRHGITTRAELARLDLRTAHLIDGLGAELVEVHRQVAAHPRDQTLLEALGADAEGWASRAATAGLLTVADVKTLDPQVVALGTEPLPRLTDAVDQAWVSGPGGGAPHLRRGVDALVVPSADVEIDIDMESTLDGEAYLWGAWHDGRYQATVRWSPMTPEVEAEVFVGFWTWLSATRRAAAEHGRSFAAYCWHQNAEAGALRRGARAAVDVGGAPSLVDDVEGFLAGGELVDLLEVFRRQLMHGQGDGLKVVAPKAGFTWRDASPSGDDSMAWHLAAVSDPDPAARDAARSRLLAYNEDDVLATVAVRSWMRALPAPRLPSI